MGGIVESLAKRWRGVRGRITVNVPTAAPDLPMAASILLLEVASADGALSPKKRQYLESTLGEQFGLAPRRARALLARAEDRRATALEPWRYARVAVEHLSTGQRRVLACMLEEVAHLDAEPTPEGRYTLGKVSALLRVDREPVYGRATFGAAGCGRSFRRAAAVALWVLGLVLAPSVAQAQTLRPDPSAVARTVVVSAGERYEAGPVHQLMLGPHYRPAWGQKVEAPILSLSEIAGGLEPLRAGGGRQTRSLRLSGADGREYVFRSVDKDPSSLLDEALHGTVLDAVLQDGISAAHPYAALVAAPLSEAAGVLTARPRLLVMPDDPALGEFRGEFGGMLGLLEERPDENDGGSTSFGGAVKVIGSDKLTEKLAEGPADRVDARAYLRARLVDVFLGDWDRHRGQWRWATYDEDAPRRWLPIARDRDQAFSRYDGVLPWVASLYVPQLNRFGPTYSGVKRLHWNARAIDRWFLAELDRDAWEEVGHAVRSALTDGVIEAAVRELPDEVERLHGAWLTATLKARRDRLPGAWDAFYETLTRQVDIRATDADDVVSVDRSPDGETSVSIREAGDAASAYFVRVFDPTETDEIRIHLLGGDDHVVARGEGDGGPLVRLVGGGGDDRYQVRGPGARISVHDHRGRNSVEGGVDIDDRPWEGWEWSEEDRDQPVDWGNRAVPTLWSSYDGDVGLFVGGGVSFERYGFRARPYSSALHVRAGYAPAHGRGRLEIDARHNRSNSPIFWSGGVRWSGLDVIHFYGLGNETDGGSSTFHRADLARVSAGADVGFSPAAWFEASAGVVFEGTRVSGGRERFVSALGSQYGGRSFDALGVRGRLTIDPLVNSERTAHRLRVELEGVVHPRMLDVGSVFGRLRGELSALLASSSDPAVSLAIRAGAEELSGRFPWHYAALVGGEGSIRGYDQDRFAGDAAVFASTEVRLRVFRPRVVVPTTLGVFGFVDTGRVFVDGASPGGWHSGVGGGLYLRPVAQPYVVRMGVARSVEGTKLSLRVGLPY